MSKKYIIFFKKRYYYNNFWFNGPKPSDINNYNNLFHFN